MLDTGLKSAKLSDSFFYFSSILFILSFYCSYVSFFAFLGFLFFYDKKPALKLTFFSFFPFAAFLYSGVFKSLFIYYGLNFFISLALFFILVCYHFFYIFLPVYINKKLKLGIIFLPFLFVAFEYLKSKLFYGLPLGNFSLLAWNIPLFIKSASYFGPYFVSLELILANVALYMLLKKDIKFILPLAFVALFLFIPINKPKYSFTKTISIVQGGIPQNEKWESKFLNRNLNIYINATKSLKSDTVFWPESAYPYIFEISNNPLIGFMKNKKFSLISGVVRKKKTNYFNSVVFIKGKKLQFYNKQILVPFAEFLPLRSITDKIIPKEMDPGDFSRGKRNVVFNDGKLKVGPMICYEEAFGSISRRYKNEGANLLAILTNDAWFSKTPTFYLLGRNAVFRAVENSIWVVRVANNGISEIISPNGSVIAKLKPYKKGVLTKKVKITVSGKTPFDRGGYLFPIVLIAFVSLSIFYRKYTIRKSKV